MASERVRRILIAQDAPFSEPELEEMSDAEGWGWIYGTSRFDDSRTDRRRQVCFTGFRAGRREQLEELAESNGLRPVGSVTKRLALLCAGSNAGPSKLAKAADQGVQVVGEDEFLAHLEEWQGPVPEGKWSNDERELFEGLRSSVSLAESRSPLLETAASALSLVMYVLAGLVFGLAGLFAVMEVLNPSGEMAAAVGALTLLLATGLLLRYCARRLSG